MEYAALGVIGGIFGFLIGSVVSEWKLRSTMELFRLRYTIVCKESGKLANRIHRQRLIIRRLKNQLANFLPPKPKSKEEWIEQRRQKTGIRPSLPH